MRGTCFTYVKVERSEKGKAWGWDPMWGNQGLTF